MGMHILDEINRSTEIFDEKLRLRIIAWNGIIFNVILDWAERGFAETPHQLAIELTKFTLTMFDN